LLFFEKPICQKKSQLIGLLGPSKNALKEPISPKKSLKFPSLKFRVKFAYRLLHFAEYVKSIIDSEPSAMIVGT